MGISWARRSSHEPGALCIAASLFHLHLRSEPSGAQLTASIANWCFEAVLSRGIPLSWLLRECAGAEAQGVPHEQLLSESLIELQYGDDRDCISPAQYVLLWMNLGRSIEDAAHGLARTRLHLGYSALALRVMLGSATLEGALRALDKFYALVGMQGWINLRTDSDHAMLTVRCESSLEGSAAVMEDTGLGWLFMCCTYFLGRPLPVIDVSTRDSNHFSLGALHWATKAPVRYGSATTMRFSRSLLGSPRFNRPDDDIFWGCFKSWLPFIEGGQTGGLAGSIGASVPALRLNEMASKAGISTSTLRRRLEEREGGFRHARQRALAEAGIKLLVDTDASVETIAEQLGYSDARSFRRFLKSATGKTPSDFRGPELGSPDLGCRTTDVHRRIQRMATLIDA